MTIINDTFAVHSNTSFLVPAGVFSLAVHIIGASGGESNVSGHPGGWGPLFDGTLVVTPGETLYLQVGQFGGGAGGASAFGSGTAGYPDGGVGGIGPAGNRGGGGAGSSRIWRGSVGGTLLILVAGGGGSSAREGSANPATGNGAVPIGEATTGGPVATGNGGNGNPSPEGGQGATPSTGGAAGTGSASGTAGSLMLGGNGAIGSGNGGINNTFRSGGGGGGGYYGGGGGGRGTPVTGTNRPGGSGGGGSSFIDLAQGWTGTIWDTTVPNETGSLSGRDGRITFTYNVPSPGGWSLGLVTRLG